MRKTKGPGGNALDLVLYLKVHHAQWQAASKVAKR